MLFLHARETEGRLQTVLLDLWLEIDFPFGAKEKFIRNNGHILLEISLDIFDATS